MARSTTSTPYLSVLLFLRMILRAYGGLCWPLYVRRLAFARALLLFQRRPTVRAPSSVTPVGNGALCFTALGVHIRHSRRLTVCARCFCRSYAGLTHGASSRGIRLLGANFPGAPSCDSTNATVTLSRGPWRKMSLEQLRLDRKQRAVLPCRLVNLPTTLMKIRIRRNVIKT